jgi:hypothetical protein
VAVGLVLVLAGGFWIHHQQLRTNSWQGRRWLTAKWSKTDAWTTIDNDFGRVLPIWRL